MMKKLLTIACLLGYVSAFTACGSGGGGTPGPGLPPPNNPLTTNVTVTFDTTYGEALPLAVAYQTNGGAWTAGVLAGNTMSISVPNAATTYGFAYSCGASSQIAYVLAISDTTTPRVSCGAQTNPYVATISAPILAGATSGIVCTASAGGTNTAFGPTLGNVNANFNAPTSDIFESEDQGSGLGTGFTPLLMHIIRGVTLSANQTIALAPMTNADALTSGGTLGVSLPAGFTGYTAAFYTLADGNTCPTAVGAAPLTIPVPSAGNVQPGDYFSYFMDSIDGSQEISAESTSTSGASLQLPVPSPFVNSPPVPADAPSFAFAPYAGFTFNGTLMYQVYVRDTTASVLAEINVSKAAAGSAVTFTVPNLSAIPGFYNPVVAGHTIQWTTTLKMTSTIAQQFIPSYSLGLGQQSEIVSTTGSFAAP